jgi:hypothetical protein
VEPAAPAPAAPVEPALPVAPPAAPAVPVPLWPAAPAVIPAAPVAPLPAEPVAPPEPEPQASALVAMSAKVIDAKRGTFDMRGSYAQLTAEPKRAAHLARASRRTAAQQPRSIF